MNTFVQAAALTVSVKTEIVDATISVSLNDIPPVAHNEIGCLYTFKKISINGHSIKAINPDSLKVGELTTLAMA